MGWDSDSRIKPRWRRGFGFAATRRHGAHRAVLSMFHGWDSVLRTELRKRRMSSTAVVRGPADANTPGAPAREADVRSPNGIRPTQPFKPYVPQQRAGMRTEPPISVPTPMSEPRSATNAPSPPLLPPGVRVSLCGLRVRPKRLLSESAVWLFGISSESWLVYQFVALPTESAECLFSRRGLLQEIAGYPQAGCSFQAKVFSRRKCTQALKGFLER